MKPRLTMFVGLLIIVSAAGSLRAGGYTRPDRGADRSANRSAYPGPQTHHPGKCRPDPVDHHQHPGFRPAG